MLSLIDPSTVPPGGFRYLQKETKTTLSGPSFPELLMKVRDHRLANNLPISLEWKQQVEHDMCEEMPPNVCRHVFGVRDVALPSANRALSLAEVLSGVKTIGAWMFHGFSKVSQEEADSRAKICASCPYNQPDEGCTACSKHAIGEAIQAVIGTSRTIAHDILNSCAICGCTLRVAVWVPMDLILKHSPPTAENTPPEWCWKKG